MAKFFDHHGNAYDTQQDANIANTTAGYNADGSSKGSSGDFFSGAAGAAGAWGGAAAAAGLKIAEVAIVGSVKASADNMIEQMIAAQKLAQKGQYKKAVRALEASLVRIKSFF